MASCDELETCEFIMNSLGDTSLGHGLQMQLCGQVGPPSLLEYGVTASVPHAYEPVVCGDSSDSSKDIPTPKASDRESRIRAEKKRRSQYNLLISELVSLLPPATNSPRKIDKTSVLRLAANELRNHHVFGNTIKCDHQHEPWSKMLGFLDMLGGFIITITCRGRISNVSPNVQDKLGHCYIDLLGQNIYEYIHPDDVETLRQHIYPPELHTGHESVKLFEARHDFMVRIIRSGSRSDPPRYEQCRIDGSMRKADNATSCTVQDEQIIRRQRVRKTRTFLSSGNDYVFIGMVRVVTNALPPRITPPTAYSEYWTRHLMDGRIVQVDQSISLVAGYMTEEVTGTSAFFYMHKEDVRWVICVLRQMYDQSKEFGESFYRLMSRTGDFLYMRTRGFLEIDPQTKQVQSFVCINSVIGEEYGKQMLEEMKLKYSMIVNVKQNQQGKPMNDIPVEQPHRLERIVMHLVEPSDNDTINPIKIIPPSKDNIITAIKKSETVLADSGIKFDISRKRKNCETDDVQETKKYSAL